MYVSISELEVAPEEVDRFVDVVTDELASFWREVPGIVGATIGVDRAAGRVVSVSYWRGEEEMRSAEHLFANSHTILDILARATVRSRTHCEVAFSSPGAAATELQRGFFE